MAHTDPHAKDRVVTDEHPGYDPRTHWWGEGARRDYEHAVMMAERERRGSAQPNLRRVRVWAEYVQAATRIGILLAMFAAGVLVGAYAESAVWR